MKMTMAVGEERLVVSLGGDGGRLIALGRRLHEGPTRRLG